MSHSTSGSERAAGILSAISRGCFYLLFAAVPLVYLPWTVDALEINKQTLVIIVGTIAALAWLGSILVRKEFLVRPSWILVPSAAFLASTGVSSALSLAPVVSWIGQSTQEYTSFITVLSFVLLFALGAQVLGETAAQRCMWMAGLFGSSVVSVFAFFVAIGHPLANTLLLGTPDAFGLYLATFAVIGSGLWVVSAHAEKNPVLPDGWRGMIGRGFILITLLGAVVTLLELDTNLVWIPLIAGFVVMFTFALYRASEFPKSTHFVGPMMLFVIALVFLFLPSFLPNKFPVEVAPSMKATLSIAQGSLKDTSWFFGSGPGTFVLDYVKFKPLEVNATSLWDTRFDRGSSQILTMLATFGAIGTGLYLLLILSIFIASLDLLIRRQPHDEWKMTFVAFAGWTVIVFGQFFYSSNLTLSFIFWMLSAILVSQIGGNLKRITLSSSPRGALLTTFTFVLFSVGMLTVAFLSVSRYASEIAYARGVHQSAGEASIDSVLTDLDTAARLNKWSDLFYRNLASVMLAKSGQLLNDPTSSTDQVQQSVAQTIAFARRSTSISPNYVVNWALLGDVYRELSPLVGNASVFAVDAYQQAIDLAPGNPKYYSAQGRAYLIYADELGKKLNSEDSQEAANARTERDKVLQNAVDVLNQAIALKPDYGQAYYYLSSAYERQGNVAEAIARMESLRNSYPLDVGIQFELGLLYLKQGKTELAKTSLQKAIEIAPNYSNAHWYLSAIYEQNGDVEAAIAEVEAIQQVDPENAIVNQRLDRLKAGETVKELPEPLDPAGETASVAQDAPVVETNP